MRHDDIFKNMGRLELDSARNLLRTQKARS